MRNKPRCVEHEGKRQATAGVSEAFRQSHTRHARYTHIKGQGRALQKLLHGSHIVYRNRQNSGVITMLLKIALN